MIPTTRSRCCARRRIPTWKSWASARSTATSSGAPSSHGRWCRTSTSSPDDLPRTRSRPADALLLIGPWTHGAELVTRGQLPRRVGAMGGTIRPVIHHGELRVVEHNVSRNPDAARVLLAQQQPLLITPLDVTATIECTREEERALVRAELRLEPMLARWRRARGDVALCLHDPLALLALVGEPGIEIERCALSVGRNGVMRSHGALHDIVVAADRHAIVTRVLTLLG